ncbi:MAG: M56 family metallopeptidase [Planctomycetota bacterium]
MTEDLLVMAWRQYWQLSVLVLLVALIGRLTDKRAPRLQHTLWLAVFVKAITPPIWTSSFGLFSWSQAEVAISPVETEAASSSPSVFTFLASALMAIWLAGLVTAVAVQWRRFANLRRLVADNLTADDTPICQWANETARELGLRRSPRVVVSPGNLGPAVFGLWRATILLPRTLVESADESVLRPIIRHELLHARRGDTFFAALQAAVAVVWWHNPLIWFAIASSNRVAERCVDRDVIRRFGEACGDYARALLRVVELRTKPAPASGLAGLCSAEITADRLKDVFDETRRRRAMPRIVGRVLRAATLIAALAIILPGRPTTLLAEECCAQPFCLQVAAESAMAAGDEATPAEEQR